jgi:hypothetical protein
MRRTDFKNTIHTQVGILGKARPDPVSLVCFLDMHTVCIGIRIYRNSLDLMQPTNERSENGMEFVVLLFAKVRLPLASGKCE